MAIGNFSIAVDDGIGDKKKTYFFNMTAFGKTAESLEKYVKKGNKVVLECKAVQENYTDKNGNKVNAVKFTVLSWEFAESKNNNNGNTQSNTTTTSQNMSGSGDGFMNISDGIDEELPFN